MKLNKREKEKRREEKKKTNESTQPKNGLLGQPTNGYFSIYSKKI